MATTPDDILINAVMQAESRGKRFDKAGNLLTSVKGAQGEMQVMPTTQTKPGFGVKPAQDSSAEEKARVGRDYLKAMISKYGDTTTALAAYNWGPGKVNKWLEKGGDFNKLPEETKKYIKTIQASLPKGTQLASAPPVKVKPPVKASTNRVAPAAPAKPPVSITKEMVADLGPNYQAALAAMALGDTREDDDDEESIAERYAAKQEKLAEEAASVPPPRIAGMELTYQSPFPEEQIAQAPEGLAHGGVPRRGNSARDALRMMKEAQRLQQQQPVQRADGSPEEGEKDLSEDPIGDFLNKYELEQLRKKIAENDAAITDLEPVPTEVETGSDPMLLDISPARKRAIEANPELFEYGTAQLKDEEYARPMLRNDPDTFNEDWLEYKLRPRGQSDFSNKYPSGMELPMPYPRTPVKPKRWEAWDQYYAEGGVVRRAEGSPEEGEKTKLPEGGDSVRRRDVEDLLGSVVGMNLPERGKVLASNLRFTPTEGLNIGAINTLVQGMSPKDIRQFMLNLDIANKAGINLTKEGLQDIYANIKGENNTNYQASYNPRGKAVSLQRMGKEGNFGVTLSPDYQGAYYQSQFANGGVVRRADGSPEEGEKAAATARDLYAQIKRSGESIDEGGLKYWTERAQSNQQSPEELQKAFMAAADVADDPYYEVNRMYQRINQTPDTEGFNYWVNRAQQEKLTPQQLGSQFIGGMPAITQAENRPGFGVGGQYGTYNGLPMLYAPEVDRVMDREQRVTGDLVNADNAIGWDPASMSGELSRGAAAAGVYRTPFRMGGDQQAFQGDLVGTAKQYGIDPEQYMQPTAGQYGQPAGSALNENALYKALDEKMKDYYAVQGYVPPAGTANSAFNRPDIGGDHARVMYQRVGDRLVPMENTLQYSNMQRAPKYSWTDYIAPAAIIAAPWALPYMSTIASAVNWGPIGAEVGKGALIGAGKNLIQGKNPITGAIEGGASGLIPSPFANGGPVYRAGGSPETGEYYQDPMGMDTGPITADTTKALQLRQGLSAKEALGTLKGIAKEGVSNAESALRGSVAAMPGMAGDVESIFRDEKKRKFKTTDEILKTEMPKRMTTPTKEAAGFEEVGTYLPLPVSPQTVKGTAKAALAGLKASGPQVEKALMKVAPTAEPMYITRPTGGYFPATKTYTEPAISTVDTLIQNAVKYTELDGVPAADIPMRKAAVDFIDKKVRNYLTKEAGSVSDSVREALIDGRIKIPKDSALEERFPQALINAARNGDVTAMRQIEQELDKGHSVKSYVISDKVDKDALIQDYKQNILEQMKLNPQIIPDGMLLRLAKNNADNLSPEKAKEVVANIRQKLSTNPTLFNTVFEEKMLRLLDNAPASVLRKNYGEDYPTLYGGLFKKLQEVADKPEGIMALSKEAPITSVSRDLTNFNILGQSLKDIVRYGEMIPDIDRMDVPAVINKIIQLKQSSVEIEPLVKKTEDLVKAGKLVPEKISTFGTKPILPPDEAGFVWREVVDPVATRIQAKMLNNSIGGYALPGTYGSLGKGMAGMQRGEVRIFSLYDKNNQVISNVEYLTKKASGDRIKENELQPDTITQFFGNGPRTKNVYPSSHLPQVANLLDYLKPANVPYEIKNLLRQQRGSENAFSYSPWLNELLGPYNF